MDLTIQGPAPCHMPDFTVQGPPDPNSDQSLPPPHLTVQGLALQTCSNLLNLDLTVQDTPPRDMLKLVELGPNSIGDATPPSRHVQTCSL